MADNLTPLPVKTKTAGDVEVNLAEYDGAAVGASNAIHVQGGTGVNLNTQDTRQATASNLNAEVQGDAAHDAAVSGNPVLLGGYAKTTAPTDVSTDGDAVRLWADLAGRLQVGDGGQTLSIDDGGGTVTVDGTVAVSGTVTVDSELPAAAALADNAANPTAPAVGAFNMVWDGAAWDRVPGNSTDGVVVNLGTNNDVTFSPTAPTTPLVDPKTSAALAAGGSVDLDSTDVGAATKKLTQVILTSSVPFKAILKTVANAVATTRAYFFGQANSTVIWQSPHKDYIQQAPAGAGFDGFRITFVNLDNVDAADVYVTFLSEE